jgi:hypothetical protein
MEVVLGLILLCSALMMGVPHARRRRSRRDPRHGWAAASPRDRPAATGAVPADVMRADGELWDDDVGWIDEPAGPTNPPASAPRPAPRAPAAPAPAVAAALSGRTWDRTERGFAPPRPPAPEPLAPISDAAVPVIAARPRPAPAARGEDAELEAEFGGRTKDAEPEVEFAAPPPMPAMLPPRGAAAFGVPASAGAGPRRRLGFLSAVPTAVPTAAPAHRPSGGGGGSTVGRGGGGGCEFCIG